MALASAMTVYADPEISVEDQQIVDDAVAALRSAADGLVLKPDDGSGDTQEPDDGDAGNTGNAGNQGSSTQTPANGNAGNNHSSSGGVSADKAAKTGDAAPLAGMLALILISGAAVTVTLRKRSR